MNSVHLPISIRAYCVLAVVLTIAIAACQVQRQVHTAAPPFEVIAYYSGNGADLDQYKFEQLTQVIFSFCHLRGNRLTVDNAGDSLTIRRLVALKQQHPGLKVLLSLGGWCGCEPCSGVFSTAKGREEFAASALALIRLYGADGLDLDWEYPGIEGCPGHPWSPADKGHFTSLIVELRRVLGPAYELSFAAGGFRSFFDDAVEWDKVMPLVNRVNLMTYDLVHGFSTVTGHHTALYSTSQQQHSIDFAVRYLDSLGIPRKKMIIGAAFYARSWEEVNDVNHGVYQSGKFKSFILFKNFGQHLNSDNGFVFYRDTIARAPYAYSSKLKQYATFDDEISLAEKTRYAKRMQLGGIMFWELIGDTPSGKLLEAIHKAKEGN